MRCRHHQQLLPRPAAARKDKVPGADFLGGPGWSGTHVNISGGGVTKHAKNRAEAIRFLEWLARPPIQQRFAAVNFEFPANSSVDPLPR